MRSFRLLAALAGVASVSPLLLSPLLAGDLSADEIAETSVFLAVFAVIGLLPFALIVALAAKLSGVARWTGLGLLVGLEALVAYEFVRSSDGQAGLIFLFLPFYLTVLVLLVWVGDAVLRAIGRRLGLTSAGRAPSS